ncbi:lipocalin family protein [Flavobacterium xueshanense]|uniref:Lipocalin-like domain-containing protein n=1 Tax=Flavobacterium xueshanense TaxID=935223 RepID=A0A1I2GKF0_9FLAO|nr:lipocalin family protein [Flavobacterium xueshanense]SFF17206.1 Lipocalin-like domain-containing protein [Flavobacterium xueshanense]
MKKVILLCTLAVLMFACKSTSATGTNTDRKSQVAMKGNWVISSVTYPGSQYVKVNTFQIADSECFVGSNWKFVSNNNKGTMALTKANCMAFSSPITWFINKEGQFVLKVLNAGEKARKVREGYVLNVANQTESSFQLIDKINVGGKMTDVVYQFQKVN